MGTLTARRDVTGVPWPWRESGITSQHRFSTAVHLVCRGVAVHRASDVWCVGVWCVGVVNGVWCVVNGVLRTCVRSQLHLVWLDIWCGGAMVVLSWLVSTFTMKVRSPLATIGALTSHLFSSKLYMARVCNLTTAGMYVSDVHFAALVYVCWNNHIETFATLRVRVEDDYLASVCRHAAVLCDAAAVRKHAAARGHGQRPNDHGPGHALSGVPAGPRGGAGSDEERARDAADVRAYWTNHREHVALTWAALGGEAGAALTDAVRCLARRYGYPDTDASD